MTVEQKQNEKLATDRFLIFSLGIENFAIPLLSVREVIAIPRLTSLPMSPPHFLGITNLRGQIIPVIDLRKKLSIKENQSAENAVIICDFGVDGLGVVVDSVNSVANPEAKEISPRPDIQGRNAKYIAGVYKVDKSIVLLLDIPALLDERDLSTIQKKGA